MAHLRYDLRQGFGRQRKLRWAKDSVNVLVYIGEMAERSNAAVLKTVVLLSWDRGFESLFLRITNHSRSLLRDFYFLQTEPGLPEQGLQKIKRPYERSEKGSDLRYRELPNGITDERSKEVILWDRGFALLQFSGLYLLRSEVEY
jgi:hypothetical protein